MHYVGPRSTGAAKGSESQALPANGLQEVSPHCVGDGATHHVNGITTSFVHVLGA